MKVCYVLFNPYADNNKGEENAKVLNSVMSHAQLYFYDITKISNLSSFVQQIPNDEDIIICGGDGTLNRFANSVDTDTIENDIYLFSSGTGNDFLRDIGIKKIYKPVKINKYLKNLPVVTVNGKTHKFINNASFGLDGYCCEEADRQREHKGKSSDYTLIAIKGLLGAYKPRNAKVIVDGKEKYYEKVWLSPTMNGRYFGGGLMAAPGQNRLNEKHTISLVVMYGSSRLKSLLVMPSMIKGNHIKRTEMIEVLEGKEITVIYDKPASMQLDGETILNVTRCDIKASK